MFTNLFSVLTSAVVLLGSAFGMNAVATTPAALAAAPVTSELALPSVTAKLTITPYGGGYYTVLITGRASVPNATFGVRVYGEDTFFDDFLFSIFSFSRTDSTGFFSVSQLVHRNTLNEDWEGADEIYAKVEVSGAGSVRTNTVTL